MRAGFSFGKPPINKALFYLTKAILSVTFAFLVLASFFREFFSHIPGLIQNEVPDVQKLMCMIFLFAGIILLLPAYYTMGIFTRVGLPTSEHVLQTEGVYRVSRNPMYTSFFFFFAACFLLIPSLILAALMLFNLIIHHLIIKKEESYLESAFGEVYLQYKKSVARYL
ncbi:methyltransferase family protein [Mangrovibacterium lignilyticum]|uniref:methyltransferase family protein n=1 Tax=Mangrovibacterium lignilyticum TaxID=2668052 RepID=UPI0013D6E61B|nr:isoprenylcysteine carboxylmethyltransferase family protein [Mangrovibacterium lignilyticum]